MKHVAANRFWESFNALPLEIQKLAREKFKLFVENPYHPSLRTKRMNDRNGIWEGHISLGYVFTFKYEIRDNEQVIVSLDIGKHDDVYNRI